MNISVIITTYNEPTWLDRVLCGYFHQSDRDFRLIVADDGSGPETEKVIEAYRHKFGKARLLHVWQEDEGFQKSRIMNKAILATDDDYLIFSDGDCIPRRDFVQTHRARSEKGYFLSGGYFKLNAEVSRQLHNQHIESGEVFSKKWLYERGLPHTYKTLKLTARGWQADLLNWITPARSPWNGHNSSGWREDILKVNGFDERMQYGGQDRELGERMVNAGIKSRQIRYSAICVHLEHARPYRTEKSISKNREIRATTKKEKRTWTEYGISTHQPN
jgi:glycosyltransferase involved in cell wall biosynthesis